MLIESNENKSFGIIIYSENKFDFITNFTRIDKREPEINEHVDFKEVSKFISEPTEKNLIMYRLLTNDENLDPFSSKLGYFIKVEEKIEVIYFDPIFIIKDIENLNITIPKEDFRFKIQQVGYRTKQLTKDSSIYEERFAIGMSEVEAQNQNDSVFAKTMLSVNRTSFQKKQKSSSLKSKNDLFKNVSSDSNKSEKPFYRLDGNTQQKNTSFVEKPRADKKGTEEDGFFSRVKLN
ncbi:MAG: hypothetical protein PF445_12620, partial [Melioribacteraceae bacterium]|nr:hypothetical protein [Melioribacteraceae bacterium]